VRVLVAWLAIVSCGCGARTELGAPIAEDASVHDARPDAHDAGSDVALDVGSDAPPSSPLCAATDAGPPAHICSVSVRVGAITPSMATCFVDTVVHEGDVGTVRYACQDAPSLWAVADFDGGEFVGTVKDDSVGVKELLDLCTGTTFPWSDGCTWASAQRITGGIMAGKLSFTYEEQPIQGTGCEPPCSATGTLIVQ
jgi:hypothetical protein